MSIWINLIKQPKTLYLKGLLSGFFTDTKCITMYQSLMQMLPRDKVTVIEENFEKNKTLLKETLQNYVDATENFMPYQDSMQELSSWLSTKPFYKR